MSTTSATSKQVGLSEVLKSIENASKSTFKDKSEKAYAPIYTSSLREWSLAILAASKDADSMPVIKDALQKAKDELAVLTKASEAKDLELQRLKDLVVNAEKAAKAQKAQDHKQISGLKISLEAAKGRKADAEKVRDELTVALSDAKSKLTSPEAKFLPEEASLLRGSIAGLEHQLQAAKDAVASERALVSELNRNSDLLYKEVAAKERELSEAKADLANFKKQLAAARLQNHDLFNREDLDFEALTLAFGAKGVEKLKRVLDIPSFDVRGRVQKLTGFFSTVAKTTSKTFFAMIDVLDHALDVLKQKTGSWASVLFPWVNGILKDIVFCDLKPVSFYRKELENILAAVKAQMPTASVGVKLHAAQKASTKRRSWEENAYIAIADANDAVNNFGKKFKELLVTSARFSRSVAGLTLNTGVGLLSRATSAIGHGVKSVALGAKLALVYFRVTPRSQGASPTTSDGGASTETHNFDLDKGEWVVKDPIVLFDSEVVD